MDIASLIGFLGAMGMIAGAMISAGGLGMYIDVPSMLIVFGGTFFAVMYRCELPQFLGSFGVMGKVFMPGKRSVEELISRVSELATIARKDGMMALEGQEVPDKFFEKGMQKKYGDNWESIVSKIDEKYPNRKQYDNSSLLQTVFNRAELDKLIDKERQKTLGIDEESTAMVDVLGEVPDDTGEKIITKVVEKTNNKGLEKLSAIEEDSKEEEEKDNSNIKSVTSQ